MQPAEILAKTYTNAPYHTGTLSVKKPIAKYAKTGKIKKNCIACIQSVSVQRQLR